MARPLAVRRIACALGALLLAAGPALAEDEKPAAPAPSAPAPRGRVGFQPTAVRGLSPEQRAELGVEREAGTVVLVVVPGGPAAKAGLRVGDVVLRYRGKDVPDDAGIDGPEAARAWAEAFAKLTEGTKAGDAVEIVVEREGKPVTLTATAVGESEMRALDDAAKAAAKPAPLPSLASAGEPAEHRQGFDVPAAGKLDGDPPLPEGFFPASGRWRVVPAEPGGAASAQRAGMLRQDRPTEPWAVLLVAGKGRAYADGTASVRFQPLSGEIDASGGIVFRAQDAENYYFTRGNSLEGNLRIYRVKGGVRSTLASLDGFPPPELGAWHTLEVSFVGTTFKATLDGTHTVEAKGDETFASGWTGLWTKADSVTNFDDWKTAPAAKPATPAR
jgi:hypothetical protein